MEAGSSSRRERGAAAVVKHGREVSRTQPRTHSLKPASTNNQASLNSSRPGWNLPAAGGLVGALSGPISAEALAFLDSDARLLQMHPVTLGFKSPGVEGEYLASVAKRRLPILVFIFCFDVICYIFRIAAKWWTLPADGSLHLARDMGPQLGSMAALYTTLGLVNRRSRRLGEGAAQQEEVLLSVLMAAAIGNLLLSLTVHNARDYIFAGYFLITTTSFLKIRWYVGASLLLVPTAGSIIYHTRTPETLLPQDAVMHIIVGWAVGALFGYLTDSYRRQMFANHKLAYAAAEKEVREAHARLEAQNLLAAAQAEAASRRLTVAKEKAANEAKSEFMSLMCHEVRTPLNGCLASAEMLLETPLEEEQRELANTIRISGSILLSTVSNFLDFFKMEAGKQLDIVRAEVNIKELVGDVHCIIEAMLGRTKELNLMKPATDGVPDWIMADPDRLRGILLNLYTNAAKFTKQGTIALKVSVLRGEYKPRPHQASDFMERPIPSHGPSRNPSMPSHAHTIASPFAVGTTPTPPPKPATAMESLTPADAQPQSLSSSAMNSFISAPATLSRSSTVPSSLISQDARRASRDSFTFSMGSPATTASPTTSRNALSDPGPYAASASGVGAAKLAKPTQARRPMDVQQSNLDAVDLHGRLEGLTQSPPAAQGSAAVPARRLSPGQALLGRSRLSATFVVQEDGSVRHVSMPTSQDGEQPVASTALASNPASQRSSIDRRQSHDSVYSLEASELRLPNKLRKSVEIRFSFDAPGTPDRNGSRGGDGNRVRPGASTIAETICDSESDLLKYINDASRNSSSESMRSQVQASAQPLEVPPDMSVASVAAEMGSTRERDSSSDTPRMQAAAAEESGWASTMSRQPARLGEQHNHWLVFEVMDTGCGVAEKELRDLFKEYVQGSDEEMRKPRSRGGTGLGLSICSKQIAMLGGRIGAMSKPAVGSTFWCTIPLILPENPSPSGRVGELRRTASWSSRDAFSDGHYDRENSGSSLGRMRRPSPWRQSVEDSKRDSVCGQPCNFYRTRSAPDLLDFRALSGVPFAVYGSDQAGRQPPSSASPELVADVSSWAKSALAASSSASASAHPQTMVLAQIVQDAAAVALLGAASNSLEARRSQDLRNFREQQPAAAACPVRKSLELEQEARAERARRSLGSRSNSSRRSDGAPGSSRLDQAKQVFARTPSPLQQEGPVADSPFAHSKAPPSMLPPAPAAAAGSAAARLLQQHRLSMEQSSTALSHLQSVPSESILEAGNSVPSVRNSSVSSNAEITAAMFTSKRPRAQTRPSMELRRKKLDCSALQGRRVLLAEDNLINQTVAKKMLTQLGMLCSVASNGQDAVDAVQRAAKAREQFDCVLMDMSMPVMGGVDATKYIRSTLGIGLPIVAMTANASDKDRDECLEAGMDGFLSKPVLKDRLAEAIMLVLSGRGRFKDDTVSLKPYDKF